MPERSNSDKEQQLAEQRAMQLRLRDAERTAEKMEALEDRRTRFQQAREENAANAAQSWREAAQEQETPNAFSLEEQLRALREKLIGEEIETPAPGLLSGLQVELLPLVTRLPENFPFEEWDTMSTKQQRATIEKTDLSREEQWIILNAKPSIRTIANIWALVQNQAGYGLTETELVRVITQLQDIGALRTSAENHGFYLGSDQRQEAFLRYIKEMEEEVYEQVEQRASGRAANVAIRKDFEKLNNTALAMLKTPPATTPIPVMEAPPIPEGDGQKAYVFYTDKPGAKFGRQAKYYNDILMRSGYNAEEIRIDNVAEFMEEWEQMDARTGAAIILCHCNGMSLLFEEGASDNAISANGRSSTNATLPAISDLKGPGTSLLYLFACNAAHEELLMQKGTNAADAFRDLPTVDTVYAYDGSISFGIPVIRDKFGRYPTKLSFDQGGYGDVFSRFNLDGRPIRPGGLKMYSDD